MVTVTYVSFLLLVTNAYNISAELKTLETINMKDVKEQCDIHVVVVSFVCEHKYKDNVCDWRGVRKCLICSKLEKAN